MNQRIPVAISLNHGTVVTTGGSATFDAGNPRAAMESYLRLVRSMRSQRRAKEVHLRQRDVDAMAIDLNMPSDAVVEELCTLMGVTRSQLPGLATLAVAGTVASVVAVVGVPALIDAVTTEQSVIEPATQVETVSGESITVDHLGSSSGVWIGADGTETEVELGGAPVPLP